MRNWYPLAKYNGKKSEYKLYWEHALCPVPGFLLLLLVSDLELLNPISFSLKTQNRMHRVQTIVRDNNIISPVECSYWYLRIVFSGNSMPIHKTKLPMATSQENWLSFELLTQYLLADADTRTKVDTFMILITYGQITHDVIELLIW